MKTVICKTEEQARKLAIANTPEHRECYRHLYVKLCTTIYAGREYKCYRSLEKFGFITGIYMFS